MTIHEINVRLIDKSNIYNVRNALSYFCDVITYMSV